MKKVLVFLLVSAVALASVFAGGAKESTTTSNTEKKKPTSMALILSGPANDQGWNAVAVSGLKATAEKFGFKTSIMENVDIASSEAAFRQLAAEGYDIVIGHGYQYGEPAVAVSSEFPDNYFLATESNSFSDNAASYVMACEQGAYVMGLLCASMSKSKTIGVIGGFEQPSITKELEAFKLAAKKVDPTIKVFEIYINSFTDTNLGYEAAMTMIDRGADVIYQVANQAGNGALIACSERGCYCAGNSYDQNSIAPNNVLSSTIYNMDQVMITAVSAILDGTFKGGVYNLGMDKKVVEIADYHALADKVPQNVKDLVADACAQIKAGTLKVPVISTPTK
jgi:basic membrane protein A